MVKTYTRARHVRSVGLALVMLAALTSVSQADLTGTLSTTDGGLVSNWGSGTSTLTWSVAQLADGWFSYSYTLTVPQAPEISHFMVEVSSLFGAANLRNVALSPVDPGTGPVWELGVPASDAGNPGMPIGADWNNAIKFEGTTDVAQTITFESNRVPVWGDFYAKGGQGRYVFNSGLGFADPLTAAHDGPEWTTYQLPTGAQIEVAHLLVPDTVVPLPGAVLLGVLGMGAAGWRLRRVA